MNLLYIAGPMTGYEDLNAKAFQEAEEAALKMGWVPINPHDVKPVEHPGRPCVEDEGYRNEGHEHSGWCYLRAAISEMMKCHAIVVLDGWEKSVGAKVEHALAEMVHMDIFYGVDDLTLTKDWD